MCGPFHYVRAGSADGIPLWGMRAPEAIAVSPTGFSSAEAEVSRSLGRNI